jgi:DNA-binding NarL/FixJ family response regulator
MVAEGKSNRAIGETLNISVRTVEAHRSRVMLKLNFTSVTELVRYAVRNHLVDP